MAKGAGKIQQRVPRKRRPGKRRLAPMIERERLYAATDPKIKARLRKEADKHGVYINTLINELLGNEFGIEVEYTK